MTHEIQEFLKNKVFFEKHSPMAVFSIRFKWVNTYTFKLKTYSTVLTLRWRLRLSSSTLRSAWITWDLSLTHPWQLTVAHLYSENSADFGLNLGVKPPTVSRRAHLTGRDVDHKMCGQCCHASPLGNNFVFGNQSASLKWIEQIILSYSKNVLKYMNIVYQKISYNKGKLLCFSVDCAVNFMIVVINIAIAVSYFWRS